MIQNSIALQMILTQFSPGFYIYFISIRYAIKWGQRIPAKRREMIYNGMYQYN